MNSIPLYNDPLCAHLILSDWELFAPESLGINAIYATVYPQLLRFPATLKKIYWDPGYPQKTITFQKPLDGQKIKITWEERCQIPATLSEQYEVITLSENSQKLENSFAQLALQGHYIPNPDCTCYTCARFTQEYLQHLLNVGVLLGARLIMIHNLHTVCYDPRHKTVIF